MKVTQRYWLLVITLIIPITFAGAHPVQKLGHRGEDSATKQQIDSDFVNAILVAKDNYAGDVDLNGR